MSKYNYIFDITTNCSDIQVINESVDSAGNPKVIFKCKLQTADEVNQNRRIYSRRICESIVAQLKQKAVSRSLLMEVDHPSLETSDPNVIKRRAATVEIKNCGCVMRDIRMEGNDIIGEVETLSGFNGPEVARMLLYDKVNLGFSLRALGAVEQKPDGTILVLEPIKPITYDLVSNPSHASARILEYLPESVFAAETVTQYIYEGEDLSLLERDSITICENGVCEIKFIDDIIENLFDKTIKRVTFSLLK